MSNIANHVEDMQRLERLHQIEGALDFRRHGRTPVVPPAHSPAQLLLTGTVSVPGVRDTAITAINAARSGDKAGQMNRDELAVLALLEANWREDARLTQRDIVKSEQWLGCHPEHERDVVQNEWESTTRKAREIIRQLRVVYGIPVLSDNRGYFLPWTTQEVQEFINGLEQEVKAQAKSRAVTYNALKAATGVQSAFMEAIR